MYQQMRALLSTPIHALFLCILLLLMGSPLQAGQHSDTVALVVKSLNNPFFSRLVEGATEYADRNGVTLEVFGLEKPTEVDHQIDIITTLSGREYGAIVIAPADSSRLVPVLAKAARTGVKIVNIDNPLNRQAMKAAGVDFPFIGPNDFSGAKKVGQYLRKRLNNTGKVVIIDGIPQARNSQLRHQGFIAGLGEGIEILDSISGNWQTEDAYTITTRILEQYTDLDAILCANDAMAIGALQASDLAGKNHPLFITGYDNTESVRQEIRTGRILASVEQYPDILGAKSVQSGWKLLRHKELPRHQTIHADLVSHESYDKKIILSISTLQNDFFRQLTEGVRRTADLFGIDLIVLDAENSDSKQIGDLSRAIDLGADLIILNSTNSDSLAPELEIVKEFHIPVITVDRKTSNASALCHIASDNAEGGRMAGRFLAQHLTSGTRVLELEGIPGTSAANERGRGFNEVMATAFPIFVSAREAAMFDRNEARSITMHLLAEHGQFDAIFAHNDNMALGALDAYAITGLRSPRVVVGFDGIKDGLAAIRRGTLTATIAQQPFLMGSIAVQSAVRQFQGEQLPSYIPVKLSLIQ